MTAPDPFLILEGVSFFHPSADPPAPILGDLTLTVGRGEFLAVTGRGGAGKTTLLRLLAGILRPSRGRLLADGAPLPPDDLVPGAVLLFANPENGFVARTVAEEVAVGPVNRGRPADEVERIVAGALAETGISALARRQPHRLSGGEQQLVALAAALACDPRVLLLDEATLFVDAPHRDRIHQVLAGLHGRGVTLVVASQEADDLWLAGRVLVLDGGRVAWDGPPERLLGDPGLTGSFGLEPDPLAVVAAAFRAAGFDVPPGRPTVAALAACAGVSG
jgi:energy-coupling factor transporter ATP-binding protein EcfA2